MYKFEKTLVHMYYFRTDNLKGQIKDHIKDHIIKEEEMITNLKGVKAFLFGSGADDERQIRKGNDILKYFSNGKKKMVDYLNFGNYSYRRVKFWNHIVKDLNNGKPATIINRHAIIVEKYGNLYITLFSVYAIGKSKYKIIYKTCEYDKGEFEKKDEYMNLPIVTTWKERIKNFFNI